VRFIIDCLIISITCLLTVVIFDLTGIAQILVGSLCLMFFAVGFFTAIFKLIDQ
jgi:hypothetical protein